MENTKITSFKDLHAWQEGHKLVLTIYKITADFPKAESYSLTDQMRRAAVSITSNIAEGFSRSGQKEKIQFYYMSLGSLTELQNQLLISKDLNYLNEIKYAALYEQSVLVHKLLNGLIKSIKISLTTNYQLHTTK